MISIDNYLFITITFFLIIWFSLTIKFFGLKSVYFLYFFLNLTIFYGPISYYQLGFVAYSNAMSNESLLEFAYISIFIFVSNIIVLKTIYLKQSFIFSNIIGNMTFEKINNKKTITTFFIVSYSLIILYIIIFQKHFPLIKLLTTGEIGERLDSSGDIPFYITFSAISMIFIPSGFFYFSNIIKNKFLLIIILLFCILTLSARGNKCIISYFLIFYFLLNSNKINPLKFLLLILVLFFIYGILKGIDNLSDETINYLIDSPFRRLFVSQGSGYIARIEMINNNSFHQGLVIKKEVFSSIYNTKYNSGTSPTHFTGDLLVKYGYIIMGIIYVIFSIVFTRLLFTIDMIKSKKENIFILWSFFLLSFLFTHSEFETANIIRIILMIINFYFIFNISRIKIK